VPGAESCAECHGHDTARAPDTSDLGPADAGSCGKCHGESAPGVDQVVAAPQLRLRPFAGGQVHDPAKTKKAECKDCHIAPEPALLVADHVFAAAGWSKNEEKRHVGDDGLRLRAGATEPSHCEGCHWEATAELEQIQRSALPTTKNIRPPTADERKGPMGASLRLFPGPAADPFVPPR
jgi:hypothetical protein